MSEIQKYYRHSTMSIDLVLEAIKKFHESKDKKLIKCEFNGEMVKVKSLRLRTFAEHGVECVSCGVKGQYFALERNFADCSSNGPYHLNLWGTDKEGKEVLFTHDHILARCFGGKDHIDNTQTMCCFCNWEKGKLEQSLFEKTKNES